MLVMLEGFLENTSLHYVNIEKGVHNKYTKRVGCLYRL
jgi:hypothetical protein